MPAAAMPLQSGAGATCSLGNMADKALVDPRRAIELPDDVDAATVAATMNPAMSAWIALQLRVPTEAGQRVLVLGATDNAGTTAMQVAKLLSAGTVVSAGRNLKRLNALTADGADHIVHLADAAENVDIVIDYLWDHQHSKT
jgi:NADPH:quinone reductase-like Zn-dependent oxidoreductase